MEQSLIDSIDESVNECKKKIEFSILRSNRHRKKHSLHNFIYYHKHMHFKRHSHNTIYKTLSYITETEEETVNYLLSCSNRRNCRTLRNSCYRSQKRR